MAAQWSDWYPPVDKIIRELTVPKERRQDRVVRGPECVRKTDPSEGVMKS